MVPGAQSGRAKRKTRARGADVIAFPAFDANRERILAWLAQLEKGHDKAAISSLIATHNGLYRVKHSSRHFRLAEFLDHAIIALQSGECEGARCILLTAMAAFGWPSNYAEKP